MTIDTSQPGRCSSINCREAIFWRLTAKGKRLPYDPPVDCETCGGSGWAKGEDAPCETCAGIGQTQVTHFATCVDAAAFRRRKP